MNKDQFEVFLGILKNVKSENLFNPYTDICPYHDIGSKSPLIRSANLKKYFSVIDKMDCLLIGEAAGYIGCRRTGIAFTDEITFPLIKKLFGIKLERATKSGKNKEYSATQVWKVASKLINPPFLWNIVPFHPYKKGYPLTNRSPTKQDHEAAKESVKYFLKHTSFKKIFAIGKVSQKILKNYDLEVDYIRHPSYGGSNLFHEKIMDNFTLKPKVNRLEGFL